MMRLAKSYISPLRHRRPLPGGALKVGATGERKDEAASQLRTILIAIASAI